MRRAVKTKQWPASHQARAPAGGKASSKQASLPQARRVTPQPLTVEAGRHEAKALLASAQRTLQEAGRARPGKLGSAPLMALASIKAVGHHYSCCISCISATRNQYKGAPSSTLARPHEVLCRPGHHIAKQAHHDAACRLAANLDIKVDLQQVTAHVKGQQYASDYSGQSFSLRT